MAEDYAAPASTAGSAGDSKTERLMKRAERAFGRKSNYYSLLRDTYEYTQPERSSYAQVGEGQQRNRVYDSTAIIGTARLANRIQRILFPPYQRWAMLRPGKDVPAQWQRPLGLVLEKITERLFAEIQTSNFDTAINEMAHDLAVGTGVLLIENGRLGGRHDAPALRFTAVPSACVAFENGPFSTVEGIFYRRKEAARDIRRLYPDLRSLPHAIAQAEARNPDQEFELMQATYYDADAAEWKFCVIAWTEKTVLVERRYRTNPWIVIRWQLAPGEIEGRGPCLQAMPDIRTCNKVVELVLKNASLSIAGPYTAVDDGTLNPDTLVIEPGAVIPVGANAGPKGPSLMPLERSGDFSVAELVLEDMRTNIKKMLFDSQMPPPEGPVRSATEIVERMKELQGDIGAAFGRLNQEGVTPIILRCLDILDEIGEIVLPLKIDGREIAIQPLSPLAQVQAMDDVQSIIQYAQLVGSTLGPEALNAGLNSRRAAVRIGDLMGLPIEVLQTPEEVAAQQQAQAEAAQQEALLQSPAVAQIAGNATKPQEPAPSPMT
jgi:hypothetical protein